MKTIPADFKRLHNGGEDFRNCAKDAAAAKRNFAKRRIYFSNGGPGPCANEPAAFTSRAAYRRPRMEASSSTTRRMGSSKKSNNA